MPFQMGMDACVILAPLALLGVWVGCVFGMLTLIRTVRRCSKPLRAAFLVVVMVFGMSSPAFAAIPMPEHCYWLWAAGTPCWALQAVWCPCDPGPPPPPPPPDGV